MLPNYSIDIINPVNAQLIDDGDQLRNINSFEYLSNIFCAIPEDIMLTQPGHPSYNEAYSALKFLYNFFVKDHQFQEEKPIYRPDVAYGNCFTDFLAKSEPVINTLLSERKRLLAFTTCLEQDLDTHSYDSQILALGRECGLIRKELLNPQTIEEMNKLNNDYKEKLSNYYQLVKDFESAPKRLEDTKNLIRQLDLTIHRIFANPNKSLERSGIMIEPIIKGVLQTSSAIEKIIRDRLKGNSKTVPGKFFDYANFYFPVRDINQQTPQGAGSKFECVKSILAPNYKPLKWTSLPSIKEYDYKNESHPFEYRFGTQGQYEQFIPRVNPIFDGWLEIDGFRREEQNKTARKADQTNITHIYFNNLPLQRDSYDGIREVKLSEELQKLENTHDNVAVITLPCDKGLMENDALTHHQKNISYLDAWNKMYHIASGQSTEAIQDFHISKKIKKLLYEELGDTYSPTKEEEKLRELLRNSFQTLGFHDENVLLSEAEQQAVYFHFIKFELTDFIINKLKPDSFNFSCKDGIDRAGVSSAYYNLIKSIKEHKPLSEAEFIRALHAAPTMVKGRGLNKHSKMIWNVVNSYIIGQQANGQFANVPDWLINWRNQNAPNHTKQFYINSLLALKGKLVTEKEINAIKIKQSSIFKKPNFNTEIKDTEVKIIDSLVNSLINGVNININNTDSFIINQNKQLYKICLSMKEDNLVASPVLFQPNYLEAASILKI